MLLPLVFALEGLVIGLRRRTVVQVTMRPPIVVEDPVTPQDPLVILHGTRLGRPASVRRQPWYLSTFFSNDSRPEGLLSSPVPPTVRLITF